MPGNPEEDRSTPPGETRLSRKSLTSLALVCVITSIITTSAVMLLSSRRGAPLHGIFYSVPGGTSGSAESILFEPKPVPKEDVPVREVLVELWNEVEKLKASNAAESDADEPVRAFRKLASSRQMNGEMVKEALGKIMSGDGKVIDEISKYLDSAENIDFGGGMSTSGGQMTAIPDLKTALLYALYRMNTEYSRNACFKYLSTRAGPMELNNMLTYFMFNGIDDKNRQDFIPAVVKAASLMSNATKEELSDADKASGRWRNIVYFIDKYRITETAPCLKKAIESEYLVDFGELRVIEGLMSIDLIEACKVISGKLEAKEERSEKFINYTFSISPGSPIGMKAKLDVFNRLAIGNALDSGRKAKIINDWAKSVDHVDRGYPKPSREDTISNLEYLQNMLKNLEPSETDNSVKEAISKCLEETDYKLKKIS